VRQTGHEGGVQVLDRRELARELLLVLGLDVLQATFSPSRRRSRNRVMIHSRRFTSSFRVMMRWMTSCSVTYSTRARANA